MFRLRLAGTVGAGVVASMIVPASWRPDNFAARMSAPALAAPGKARIIDGTAIAAQIRSEIREQVVELKREHSVTPGLAVVLVGGRTDSKTYVRMKKRAAAEVAFYSVDREFPESVSEQELLTCVKELNEDPQVACTLIFRMTVP